MNKSERVSVSAADGHHLSAYLARPSGSPRGGVVVLQEIFGVNSETRHVADDFAAAGYLAIAPAMFDRTERDIELDYTQMERGLALANSIADAALVHDLQAAVDAVSSAGPVAAIGFCWGGALAYVAACQCKCIAAAACFYGTRIVRYCDSMRPKVPVQYHFGALDKSLPAEATAKIKAADPAGEFHLYDGADHAFTNRERPNFHAVAARLAHERCLQFLSRSLAHE